MFENVKQLVETLESFIASELRFRQQKKGKKKEYVYCKHNVKQCNILYTAYIQNCSKNIVVNSI